MPFQPGQSGNPAGRPRGARSKTSLAIEELLEGDAEATVRRVIEEAKAGNPSAWRLLIPAMLPKRKDAPIELDLPPLQQAADVPGVIASIIAAVCAGEITPQEGGSLTRMVEAYARAAQKLGEVARRASPRTHGVAAATRPAGDTVSSASPHIAHENPAPSQAAAVKKPDAPTPACEPSVNASAPDTCHPVLHASDGRSLERLRQQTLCSTSPLAQSATTPLDVVSLLLKPRPAAGADPIREAA